jgi:hypothetical protein
MLKLVCAMLGFVLFGLAGFELYRTACDSHVSLYAFINSDTLTCAAFYEDIVVNGYPVEGFYFPTTNVMFPDCAVYFLARATTGAAAPAMILSTCVVFGLQLLGLYFLMRVLTPSDQRGPQLAMLLAMGALFLLTNAQSGFSSPFCRLPLVLTYHGGEFSCLLFGLALLIYLVKAGAWERRHRLALAALYVDAALGMGSDRLLFIQFIVPALGALLTMRLLTSGAGLSLRRIALLSAPLLSGALSGQLFLRIFQPAWQDVINHYPCNLDNGWHSICLLAGKWRKWLEAGDELHWLALTWIAGCSGHLVYLGWRRCRSALVLSEVHRGLLFLSAHYLAMTATCIAAISYSGAIYNPPFMLDFDWAGAARYFLPVLFIPYFLIGIWLVALRGWSSRRLPFAAMIAALACAGVQLEHCSRIPRSDDRAVWHYYPPEVAQLDAIAEEFGLEYGLAAYWEAKLMTLLSQRRIQVHAIIANPAAATKMVAFHWLSNGRCYFDAPRGRAAPRYQFIVVKEFPTLPTPSRGELIERFGKPAASLRCGLYHVFLYNRPEDTEFQNVAEHDCYILRERYDFQVGETIRFDAHTLPSGILGEFPPRERLAIEGCTSAGVLSSGPLLNVRRTGTYRIKIVASCTADDWGQPSRWQIILFNPKFLGPITVAGQGEIEAGAMREIVVDVKVGNRRLGRAIDCQVLYSGEGVVQVHYTEVTRLK